MRRRDFIKVVVGSTAAWPFTALAQQSERMRRIGVLAGLAENDPEMQADLTAFREGLQKLGWTDGRNVQIDYRWSAGDAERTRKNVAEIVALAPDVVLAAAAAVGPLLQASRTVPIVFVLAFDPVGDGFVDSLAHPGGNATGFTLFEYGISGKWLELLKEIAPNTTRAAVFRDPATTYGTGQLGAIQAVAPSMGVELKAFGGRDAEEIERGITSVARTSNSGLIVTTSPPAAVHRDLIVNLAARYRLPTVYNVRYFATDLILSINLGKQLHTSIAFFGARSRLTFRYRRRPSTSWSSTLRLPRRLASRSHLACSPALIK
ncbi:MAG: ABC transporter substrate-binding protein [Pseudolabrys sp.]